MSYPHSRKGKIIVTGMACHLPLPGVIYQVLHYLTGLRTLGYDVYYIEDTDRWAYDSAVGDVVPNATPNVTTVASVFDAHGFANRWAYRGEWDTEGCYGMDETQIRRLYQEADALLNVTGQDIREEQLVCPRRVYIESDPFASQVRINQGDSAEIARISAHDTHFTFGENIGASDCAIPPTPFNWLPTRQPVDLAIWNPPPHLSRNASRSFTTITSWVNHVDAVVHDGVPYYWQKDREFEKFIDLPLRSSAEFELASNGDADVRAMLGDNGWRHVSVDEVAQNSDDYRDYIWCSGAEFTVSRDQYVRPRTGWFSDRSACYLAAGRPVITQETAFSKFLPTGRGLFAFSSMEEILTATEAIRADYEGHSNAAREIATEYFAAEKVVGSLMDRAGL
jgi:hypothetical protein